MAKKKVTPDDLLNATAALNNATASSQTQRRRCPLPGTS